jgi:hypothetical protein
MLVQAAARQTFLLRMRPPRRVARSSERVQTFSTIFGYSSYGDISRESSSITSSRARSKSPQ